MRIHKSGEDYLEAILIIRNKKGNVRSLDVAQHLGVTKPSVSNAVKILREGGMLEMDDSKRLTLTEAGEEIAQRVYERHLLLTKMFMSIGVSAETAEEDACRIEHDLSPETFDRLKEHLSNN
ncbi:MAG: metal-dependent transcriptional regulator [Oscillospiraceae bacterium]|nr:metal-dependent transcriptional regulator [Oscillospiraceae bacterium]